METRILSAAALEEFRGCLLRQERGTRTVEKYLRDAQAFYSFLPEGKQVDKEAVIRYKAYLTETYKAASTNSMLVAINRLLGFLGWQDCQVKLLRIQRANFREAKKELTKTEYQQLLSAACRKKNERLCLLMQTLCSTGLRVSEHRFVTAEALRCGVARVRNKGKERIVLLPPELVTRLLAYCKSKGVDSGAVFVTRSGRPMERTNIWADMKRLCAEAGVEPGKVYPHNLRHLFALTYYRQQGDVIGLADVLGHSSVETTRIYTTTSGEEQKRRVAGLGLVGHSF